MYCNNCGIQNPDGATYCNGCGKPITANMEADLRQQRNSTRNIELNELDKMIQYFSVKSDKYERYDWLTAEINYMSRGKRHAAIIWGVILAALGILNFVLSIPFFSITNSHMILGIIFLVLGVTLISAYVFYSFTFDRDLADYTEERNQIENELIDYYNSYGECSVGSKYATLSNLNAIKDTIQSGRADTIKEAINILIDDTYRNSNKR